MALFLWIAAGMSVITFVVHTWVGGKFVARPLLASTDLPKASKWLNYYCWHNTTVIIAFTTIAFVWLAVTPGQTSMIVLLSSLMTAFSLLSGFVAIKGGLSPLQFPSTSLFAIISACGWLAVLT